MGHHQLSVTPQLGLTSNSRSLPDLTDNLYLAGAMAQDQLSGTPQLGLTRDSRPCSGAWNIIAGKRQCVNGPVHQSNMTYRGTAIHGSSVVPTTTTPMSSSSFCTSSGITSYDFQEQSLSYSPIVQPNTTVVVDPFLVYEVRLGDNAPPQYMVFEEAIHVFRAHRPLCPNCGRCEFTRFRYFNNLKTCGIKLQPRYVCHYPTCHDNLFTLNGKARSKPYAKRARQQTPFDNGIHATSSSGTNSKVRQKRRHLTQDWVEESNARMLTKQAGSVPQAYNLCYWAPPDEQLEPTMINRPAVHVQCLGQQVQNNQPLADLDHQQLCDQTLFLSDADDYKIPSHDTNMVSQPLHIGYHESTSYKSTQDIRDECYVDSVGIMERLKLVGNVGEEHKDAGEHDGQLQDQATTDHIDEGDEDDAAMVALFAAQLESELSHGHDGQLQDQTEMNHIHEGNEGDAAMVALFAAQLEYELLYRQTLSDVKDDKAVTATQENDDPDGAGLLDELLQLAHDMDQADAMQLEEPCQEQAAHAILGDADIFLNEAEISEYSMQDDSSIEGEGGRFDWPPSTAIGGSYCTSYAMEACY